MSNILPFFLRQKVKLASEDTDDWGPRDENIRKDWRTKKTSLYGASLATCTRDKETPTLKKFSKATGTDTEGGTINQAFESEKV